MAIQVITGEHGDPENGICAYCNDPEHDCNNCYEKEFDDYCDRMAKEAQND